MVVSALVWISDTAKPSAAVSTSSAAGLTLAIPGRRITSTPRKPSTTTPMRPAVTRSWRKTTARIAA